MIAPNIIPIDPILPETAVSNAVENAGLGTLLSVLAAVAFIGIALLLGWRFTTLMKQKNYRSNLAVNLVLSGVSALALFLRFGLSETLLLGLYAFFLLLYASWADITSHEVTDWVWIALLPVAIASIGTVGIPSMLIAVFIVMIPQFATKKPFGGADLKLSLIMALTLGFARGVGAYLLGLSVAVIYMSIYNRLKNRSQDKEFPLVPFLAGAAFLAFLI